MFLDLLGCVALFLALIIGVGWPLASRCGLTPLETLLATTAFSLLGMFCFAWAVYVFALPPRVWWGLPVAAVVGLATNVRGLVSLARDAEVRTLGLAQALVTACCLGWLGLVSSYSGGGWAGDWIEHWERTRFFLEHGSLETKFLGMYLLPARPPLANVVTGAWLALSRVDFAHYQFFSTLLASLAFLPCALFARRFFSRADGGTRVIAVLAVLFMVNPLFVQNAVFAWTKLPTAFFVLGALWFFLRARDIDGPASAGPIFGVLLAAGLITHYSAGPYAVVLGAWWFVAGRRHWRTRPWRAQTLLTAMLGALVLATWFGWSLSHFDPERTFLSSTTFTSEHVRQGDQFTKVGLNIFDTLVPHFVRDLDVALIAQPSFWGGWRDWFFQSYQLNLPLAFGSLAWLALVCELLRAKRTEPRSAWTFWSAFVGVTALLGVATVGARDHWGLAHICLQAVVLLGLAFLASRWPGLSRRWRLILITGAAFDFVAGIVLHFAVQNHGILRWLSGAASQDEAVVSLSPVAIMNYVAKVHHRLAFFSDAFPVNPALLLAFIAGALAVALWRARASPVVPPIKVPRTAIPMSRTQP